MAIAVRTGSHRLCCAGCTNGYASMKVHFYRVGSGRLRATPRSGSRTGKRLRRPWAPYKHRDLFLHLFGLLIILICVAPVPIHYWYRAQAERTFHSHVAQGNEKLSQVETTFDHGQSTLIPGHAYQYKDPFPTSGPHDPDWVSPGFYSHPRAASVLVHSLARGMVIIYYDQLQASSLETLKDWAGLFRGDRDGVIIVVHPGLGRAIVLTAWVKRLRLTSFDPDAIAVFIDAYRGRGPQKRVR